jgi:hypothetical protein
MSDIVTIGRNVGDEPMGQEAWEEFQSALVSCFAHVECFVTGRAWSEAWGGEETYAVIGQLHSWATPASLANLGWVYSQDAVGIGTTEAVGGFGRLLREGEV